MKEKCAIAYTKEVICMLYTGSISNMDASKYDEVWVCVRSLGNVKTGGNIYHVPQLSPSKDLFYSYLSWKKHGVWNEQQFDTVYTPRFLKEMESSVARDRLALLKEKCKTKDILVVCFCDNERTCHRSLIRRLIEGGVRMTKTIAFTGRRPKDLCGYCYDNYRTFVTKLIAKLESLVEPDKENIFISGGAQGFDQLAFWAVNRLKINHPEWRIKNVIHIPFEGQEKMWKETGDFSQTDYRKMLKFADEVKVVSPRPTDYSQTCTALHKRNHSMIDSCDILVALYPSDDFMSVRGGTAEAMRYAVHVGKPIIQIRYTICNGCLDV